MTVTDGSVAADRAAPRRLTVSVVVCTWNGARWLPEFLESIRTQRLHPHEVIVQDDCSDDDTQAIVARFKQEAPFPVLLEVNQARIGSTANFERALGRATGQAIALGDQDDVWYPKKLERLILALAEDPILTLTFSDADLLDASGTPSGRRLWEARNIHRLLTKHEIVPGPWFARRALSTGCTMVARRRAVEAALPFPECLNEEAAPMRHDRWLSLVAAAVGTVRAVPEPLLGFRVHPQQQTGVLTRSQLRHRLAHTARATLDRPDPARALEHRVRAQQIEVAANRADRLGDFAEADELRRVSAHHRARADLGPTLGRRLTTVGHEIATGGYDRSPIGLSGAGADLVRAVWGGVDR